MNQTEASEMSEGFRDWITMPRSWFAVVFVLPLLRLTVGPLRRNTWIEPNHVTLLSFFLAVIAAVMILVDTGWTYLTAGLLVYTSYFLDCMDGMVARMNRKMSRAGAFLDFSLDRWKTMILSWSLCYVSFSIHSDVVTSMLVVIYLGLALSNVATTWEVKDIVGGPRWSQSEFEHDLKEKGLLGRWLAFCDRQGIRPTVADVEADMCVFFVGLILLGLYDWRVLKPCLVAAVLIYLIPLQMGHAYFAWRFLRVGRLSDPSREGS